MVYKPSELGNELSKQLLLQYILMDSKFKFPYAKGLDNKQSKSTCQNLHSNHVIGDIMRVMCSNISTIFVVSVDHLNL